MIKIFPAEKVKEIDRYTILHEPVQPIELVERAAVAFFSEFCRRFSKQSRVIVFAGQGNNGADALAIGRLLIEAGYRTEVFLFNPNLHLSEECAMNKQRLLDLEKVEFTEVVNEFVPPELRKHDVVIDGLFGIGLTRPLTGGFAAMVHYINQSEATTVAIDIPSGLFCDDNRNNDLNAIVRADFTYSFGFPKLSFFFAENASFVGEWKVLDIMLHPDAVETSPTAFSVVEEADISVLFPPRNRFAHKGMFGHALLIAGERGKMGAALLAGKACMRSGAGLLTLHIPGRGEPVVQTALPEAMVDLDPHVDYLTEIPALNKFAAVGIGPGIGMQVESAIALDQLLQTVKVPLVVDADALNLLAENPELLQKLPARTILTPHPKEFDRLAGASTSAYERLLKAQDFAAKYSICMVLKGAYTMVCMPTGNVYINTTGTPGMATAGSGDVLTGIITGLLAQGMEPEESAVAGVFLHGLAGNMAAVYRSEESMLAGDIPDMLGKAFKQLR